MYAVNAARRARSPESSVDAGHEQTEVPVRADPTAQTIGTQEIAGTASELELLQKLNEQLDAIRTQMAEREARREAEAKAAQEATAQTQEALDELTEAESRLVRGDSQVLELLDRATVALPFAAQRAVQEARRAVESEDLYRARYWIRDAIAQTQQVLARG